jgi:hypothetical protein
MSEPSAIGSGAAQLSRLGKLADGLMIVGGSEMTRRMVRPLGFRAFGEVPLYAVATASAPPSAACEAHPITPELIPAPPNPTAPWLDFERPASWLRACLTCPAIAMDLCSVRCDGQTVGEVLLAFAPGQARIAAFWPRSSEPSARAALLVAARQLAAQRTGIDEVACMANAPDDRRALEDAGFRAVGSVPMFVLAPLSSIPEAARLSFHMLDGDFAFLHDGRPRPWLPPAE